MQFPHLSADVCNFSLFLNPFNQFSCFFFFTEFVVGEDRKLALSSWEKGAGRGERVFVDLVRAWQLR